MDAFSRLEAQNGINLESKNYHTKKIALIRRSLLANIKKDLIEVVKNKYDRS